MLSEHDGIETQLFSWEGWDELDVGEFLFYNCVLNVDIGSHKVGEKINKIALILSCSIIELYDNDNKVLFTGKLLINVDPYRN